MVTISYDALNEITHAAGDAIDKALGLPTGVDRVGLNDILTAWLQSTYGIEFVEADELPPITVRDLALHLGATPDADGNLSGGEFEKVGLPIMGGCEVCGATIAAYNACPSTSGYLRCQKGCIGSDGFATVEQAKARIFGPDESDWKYEVANGDTQLGWVEWQAHQVASVA